MEYLDSATCSRARATSSRIGRLAKPRRERIVNSRPGGVSIERPTRVTCLTGELWVTGPHPGDQILEPGQSLTVAGPGRIVIEALVPATFRVTANAG